MPLIMETSTKDKTIGRFIIPDLTAEAPLTAWNQIGKKYTNKRKKDPMQNEYIAAAHIDRLIIIFGGMVAVSCFQN
jgi:hypothetical protein